MSRSTHNTVAILLACVVLASAGAAAPPRWTGVVDASGTCYYAVPADWKIDAASESVNAIAPSKDGRATAVVVWSSHSGWTSFVGSLRSTLSGIAVHEDSPRRFWIEYAPEWPGVHHVAVIPVSGGGCLLYVDLSEKAEHPLQAIAKDIIRTLTALR